MKTPDSHDAQEPLDPPDAAPEEEEDRPEGSPFPIVGIGASAGGLEAFSQLLARLPDDTGMAFLLVQHLDPRHTSQLAAILSRTTRLPVTEATHGMAIRPDHVYVIPPDTNMSLAQGLLQLSPRGERHGAHLALDHLFRSLSHDSQAQVIGVVLSGTGSDGTLGLAEIKAAGGVTMAQDPTTAQHPGMPQSAIASGCVDLILSPDAMARELARMVDHPYLAPRRGENDQRLAGEEDQFRRILTRVRAAFGVDFTHYRETTLRRRITRRMALHHLGTLGEYARLLEEGRSEVEALFHDMLINVTSFFRDPGMFAVLQRSVFPEILAAHAGEAPIRVWVAGCSTGQEAYSLAMALREYLEEQPVRPPIQIFATDLSDAVSLTQARSGRYPESIEAEVSPERLRRFFTKEEGGYRISKSIRDMCLFARQNVAADAPFSRVDLISCRNLLIYMAPTLQQRVIPTFHYALNPTGFLVLGGAETVGEFTDLFDLVDRQHKIYARKTTAARSYPHFNTESQRVGTSAGALSAGPRSPTPAEWQREADRLALSRYAPPGVLVDEKLDILQFRGRTGPYLEPAPGEASFNLLRMAREGLFLALQSAIHEARTRNASVHRPGVRVRGDGPVREIALAVTPVRLPGAGESCYLIQFEEPSPGESPAVPPSLPPVADEVDAAMWRVPSGLGAGNGPPPASEPPAASGGSPSAAAPDAEPGPDAREALYLQQELTAARDYLQRIIEQKEAANEELQSANEEILSGNEELQSTNEELETAKEELQSLNEELTTVNEQLQNGNLELTQLSNDLTNVLSSTQIPIVVLGSDLRIRRFTTPAGKLLDLLPTDVGRPIRSIRPLMDASELETMILEVIESVQPREREVRDREGRWYALRVHPYRTADHKIDGAVVVLLDIDEARRAQEAIRESGEYAQAIVETVRESLLILDGELRIQSANQAFYRTFQASPTETEGHLLYELGNGQWNIPGLRALLEEILPRNARVNDLDVNQTFPAIGHRMMRLNARRMDAAGDRQPLILLAIEDVTERKQAEAALRQTSADLAEADRRKDEILAMLAHELRNPLAPILNAVQLLKRLAPDDPGIVRVREIIERQALQQGRLLDDLLDVSRITRGTILLRTERLDLTRLVRDAVEDCRSSFQAAGLTLTLELPAEPLGVDGDPTRLAQVLGNLCQNAVKFSDRGGHVTVSLSVAPGLQGLARWAVLTIRDTGIGIEPAMLPRVFDLFAQADRSLDRSRGGLGLGLTMVKALIERQGGEVRAFSAGAGQGAEFQVRLPLAAAPAATEATPAPSSAAAGPRRILVVEDNRDAAQTLRELLEISGHTVEVAESGTSAVEAGTRFRPEVVLCDLGLPGMDGYQVAAELRRRPATAGAHLIALSGYGQEEDHRRAVEAGFDRHLTKPVEFAELERLLQGL